MERKRFSGVMLLFIVLAVVLITQVVGNLGRSGDVSYSDMRAYFTAEKVKSFTATDTRLVAKLQDGSSVSCALHSFDTFYNDMNGGYYITVLMYRTGIKFSNTRKRERMRS